MPVAQKVTKVHFLIAMDVEEAWGAVLPAGQGNQILGNLDSEVRSRHAALRQGIVQDEIGNWPHRGKVVVAAVLVALALKVHTLNLDLERQISAHQCLIGGQIVQNANFEIVHQDADDFGKARERTYYLWLQVQNLQVPS